MPGGGTTGEGFGGGNAAADALGPGGANALGGGEEDALGPGGFSYTGPNSGLSPESFNAPDFNQEFNSFNSPSSAPGWTRSAAGLGISNLDTGSYVSTGNPAPGDQAAAMPRPNSMR